MTPTVWIQQPCVACRCVSKSESLLRKRGRGRLDQGVPGRVRVARRQAGRVRAQGQHSPGLGLHRRAWPRGDSATLPSLYLPLDRDRAPHRDEGGWRGGAAADVSPLARLRAGGPNNWWVAGSFSEAGGFVPTSTEICRTDFSVRDRHYCLRHEEISQAHRGRSSSVALSCRSFGGCIEASCARRGWAITSTAPGSSTRAKASPPAPRAAGRSRCWWGG